MGGGGGWYFLILFGWPLIQDTGYRIARERKGCFRETKKEDAADLVIIALA